MAAFDASKSAPAQTPETRRQSRRHDLVGAGEEWGHGQGGGEVVCGDAAGGGDVGERQVYDLRSEGEAVSQGDT